MLKTLRLNEVEQAGVKAIWRPARDADVDRILRYLSFASDYSILHMPLGSYAAADGEFDWSPPLRPPSGDRLERMAPTLMSFDRKNVGADLLLDAIEKVRSEPKRKLRDGS